ncbi:hypothetical protein [Acidithiobacillus sp. AMEEHan]|uniref:hypothetical protein n=1 Tax=Acidithiobacillus sp. AMEEHan TaxID=2994951 RepID=UPI0027E54AAC|nr:hypothetical protein [Acidithiobacillus sp. AMEEHan]
MAVQLPYELMPEWFTVKALANRWQVDTDYIAALIGSGTIQGYVSFVPRSHRFFEYDYKVEAGIYALSRCGYDDPELAPEIQWVGWEAFSPSFIRSASEFLLPTQKEELKEICFSLNVDIYLSGPDGERDPYETEVTIVGYVTDFLVHKDHIKNIEERISQADIQSGVLPQAINTRRILLTVINALCVKAGIDPRSRSATTEILTLLELQGTPASDRTIRDAIKDIPEAIQKRKTENRK